MHVIAWLNAHPDLKAGRVEVLGAFLYWLEQSKKITSAAPEVFDKLFEEFKTL